MAEAVRIEADQLWPGPSSERHPHVFAIETRSGRVYYLSAPSRECMSEWVEKLTSAFRCYLEQNRPEDPSTPGECKRILARITLYRMVLHTHIHIYIYTTHTYIHTYTHTHTHTHTYYIHTYTHSHTHTYTHTHYACYMCECDQKWAGINPTAPFIQRICQILFRCGCPLSHTIAMHWQ